MSYKLDTTLQQASAEKRLQDDPSRVVAFFTTIDDTFKRYCLYISQFIAWVVCSILFNLIFKLEVTGKSKLKQLHAPLIIVSNHICFYDGFIIRVALGAFPKRILPLRFMAVISFDKLFLNVLTWTGIIPLVYFLLGVFVIKQGQGLEKNLEKATEVLEKDHTVVMYPEGSMFPKEIGPFKRGAAALAMKTGTPVLPLSIRKFKRFGRTILRVNIGDVISLNSNSTYEKETEVLYNTVCRLHEQK